MIWWFCLVPFEIRPILLRIVRIWYVHIQARIVRKSIESLPIHTHMRRTQTSHWMSSIDTFWLVRHVDTSNPTSMIYSYVTFVIDVACSSCMWDMARTGFELKINRTIRDDNRLAWFLWSSCFVKNRHESNVNSLTRFILIHD
jgi:hypothetical protein